MVIEHVLAESQDIGAKDPCITFLTHEQSVGLTFIVLCSFFSLLAIVVTFALYVERVLRTSCSSIGPWVFLKTDIDAYFLSLLFADMLVAFGGILNLKWVSQGRTECGTFCSAQGGLEHIGTPAVALSTLAIALHTFFVIFFRWTPPRTRVIGLSVLIGIWTFLILLVLIPALSLSSNPLLPPFYTPTPAWCYIGAAHTALRAGASYAFSWFAALGSGIMYGLLFLRLRGALIGGFRGRALFERYCVGIRWCCARFSGGSDDRYPERETTEEESEAARSLNLREARKMLLYPLCYIIIILPLSATRWTSFTAHSSGSPSRHEVPFGLTAAAASLFKLGGLVDVLLFAFTRPNILLFGTARGETGMGENVTRRLSGLISRRSTRGWFGREDRREPRSYGEAGGGEDGIEMNLRDTAKPGEESRVDRIAESGGNGSQVRLIAPPQRISTDEGPGENRPRVSVSSASRGPGQREPLVLDLADELDYYSSPVSPSTSALGSSRVVRSPERSGEREERTLRRDHSFAPLTLDLPNPRISGMSTFMPLASSLWIPMQREEVPTSLRPLSVPGVSGFNRLPRLTASSSSAPEDSRRTHEDRGEQSVGLDVKQMSGNDTTSNVREVPQDMQQPYDGSGNLTRRRSDASAGMPLPSYDQVSTSSRDDASSLDRFTLDEDPFSASSLFNQTVSSALRSRDRRLRGPRPLPSPKSSTVSSVGLPGSRPVRPTIGIPASGSFSFSSLSPQSSTIRSPRIRYPQSALAAIPEHRLLDSFPSSGSRFPHTASPTSPLSFRGRPPYSRPRSLSDGADLPSRARRKVNERETESGNRRKYSSFIDMS